MYMGDKSGSITKLNVVSCKASTCGSAGGRYTVTAKPIPTHPCSIYLPSKSSIFAPRLLYNFNSFVPYPPTMLLPAAKPLDVVLSSDNHAIHVENGNLVLSFHRTIKVPDNANTSLLPPGLGSFPLYPVSKFQNLPRVMRGKGGVFFPMYRTSQVRLERFGCYH